MYTVQIILGFVKVAERPPVGKELLTRLTLCYLYIMSVCLTINVVIYHFGFDDMCLALIVLFPGHCLRFTLMCPTQRLFYVYTFNGRL